MFIPAQQCLVLHYNVEARSTIFSPALQCLVLHYRNMCLAVAAV